MTNTLGRRLFGFGTSSRGAGRTAAGGVTAGDCLRLYEEAGGGDAELDAAASALRSLTASDARLTDALLALGGAALAGGRTALATAAAEAVLTRRKGSRAAWLLRGQALEAAGDLAGAIAAFEGYLEHTDAASAGAGEVAAKLTALRAELRWRQDVVGALGMDDPAVAAFSGAPEADFEAALARHLDDRLAAAGAEGTAGLDRAVGLYAERRRHRLRPPVADPLYGGTGRLRIGEFRNLVAGRSICLVANSAAVRGSALGAEIDAYDLVVRFTSFAVDPAATGERTDIHVTGHRDSHNWDRPVTTRLVFCDKPEEWRQALRNRLVPGAQRFTGDESLRRPLRGVGGLTPDRWAPTLTCGFEMVWLLDFLDVSPRLDLIGFDFFASDPYRMPQASHIATPSDYSSEKAWVMERAQHVAGPVTALR